MKQKLPTLAIALAALTAISLPIIANQTPAAKSSVLVDFRIDRKIRTPKITKTLEHSILTKLFRRYLDDESKCDSNFDAGNSSDPLAAARKAGQIVPSIVDMETGSFTAAGQNQTAYVIAVSECNASHADAFGTKRVAIFSGQQLLADVDDDFKSTIVRKTDLNSDGIDELVMASDDMHQGVADEVAALVSFANGRFRVIDDFGTVMEDSCASEIRGSNSTAAVVSILPTAPGKMPRLRIDNYRATCRNPHNWKFISTGKRSAGL